MNSKLKFNKLYFVPALSLLAIEILIAKFAHDQIIRPYMGDLLVVILIYCCIRSFWNTQYLSTALGVLAFSFTLETLQYFHIVNWLGLGNSNFARTVMGTSFEWGDLVAYTAGIVLVIYLENAFGNRKSKSNFSAVKTK